MLKKAEIQQRISALHAENMQRNHLTVEKVLDDLEHEKTRVLATQGLLVNRILNTISAKKTFEMCGFGLIAGIIFC